MRTIGTLARLLHTTNPLVSVHHVRSHKINLSSFSCKTDWLASALPQYSGFSFRRYVPPPTFMMDRFTLFHSSRSIETNLSRLIPNLLPFSLVQDPEFYPSHLFHISCTPSSAIGPPSSACLIYVFGNISALPSFCVARHCKFTLPALGTPSSAVFWGALPLKLFVMFLSSALPSLTSGVSFTGPGVID